MGGNSVASKKDLFAFFTISVLYVVFRNCMTSQRYNQECFIKSEESVKEDVSRRWSFMCWCALPVSLQQYYCYLLNLHIYFCKVLQSWHSHNKLATVKINLTLNTAKSCLVKCWWSLLLEKKNKLFVKVAKNISQNRILTV